MTLKSIGEVQSCASPRHGQAIPSLVGSQHRSGLQHPGTCGSAGSTGCNHAPGSVHLCGASRVASLRRGGRSGRRLQTAGRPLLHAATARSGHPPWQQAAECWIASEAAHCTHGCADRSLSHHNHAQMAWDSVPHKATMQTQIHRLLCRCLCGAPGVYPAAHAASPAPYPGAHRYPATVTPQTSPAAARRTSLGPPVRSPASADPVGLKRLLG